MKSILAKSVDVGGVVRGYLFRCPGCSTVPHSSGLHYVRTVETPSEPGAPVWGFNGSMDRPTFTPSILVNPGGTPGVPRCHSFVKDGQIQFLMDCDHALKGQTVPLGPWERQ